MASAIGIGGLPPGQSQTSFCALAQFTIRRPLLGPSVSAIVLLRNMSSGNHLFLLRRAFSRLTFLIFSFLLSLPPLFLLSLFFFTLFGAAPMDDRIAQLPRHMENLLNGRPDAAPLYAPVTAAASQHTRRSRKSAESEALQRYHQVSRCLLTAAFSAIAAIPPFLISTGWRPVKMHGSGFIFQPVNIFNVQIGSAPSLLTQSAIFFWGYCAN